VAEISGDDVAEALFVANPRAILNDRTLAWEAELPYATEPVGVIARLKRFFSK
jgi:hypothetical protein